MLQEDIKRLIRHLVPVLVIYAVSKGWLPAAAQGDVTEALLIVVSVVFSLAGSRKRDVAKK
jgi:hypothetical protein